MNEQEEEKERKKLHSMNMALILSHFFAMFCPKKIVASEWWWQ